MARSSRSTRCSVSTGLVRKSVAPSFIARTASSTVAEGGHHDDGHVGVGFLGRLQDVEPAARGQPQVGEDDEEARGLQAAARLVGVAGLVDGEPRASERLAQHAPQRLLVLDDEHVRHGGRLGDGSGYRSRSQPGGMPFRRASSSRSARACASSSRPAFARLELGLRLRDLGLTGLLAVGVHEVGRVAIGAQPGDAVFDIAAMDFSAPLIASRSAVARPRHARSCRSAPRRRTGRLAAGIGVAAVLGSVVTVPRPVPAGPGEAMAGGEGCAGRSSFVNTCPGDGSGDGEAFAAGLAARFSRATSARDRVRGEGDGLGAGLRRVRAGGQRRRQHRRRRQRQGTPRHATSLPRNAASVESQDRAAS